MFSFIRLRRHRVAITVGVFLLIVFYQFTSLHSVTTSGTSQFATDRLKEYTQPPEQKVPLAQPKEEPKVEANPPNQPDHQVQDQQPVVKPATTPTSPAAKETPPAAADSPPKETPPAAADSLPKETPLAAADSPPKDTDFIPARPGSRPGRVPPVDAGGLEKPEHYAFPDPFYPVPLELIKLPESLVSIPQIQANFPVESADGKKVRLERQKAVKDGFLLSWNAYKKYAYTHDELVPVSGGFSDPFGGWGATLVDALDTLWIMDLKEDFDEAVQAVGNIDFTTTTMTRMRVFETVIRYLGGLIAAWDLTDHKKEYKVLLDKAIELADVLYGVFDTPNRMPILMYGWRAKEIARHPHADTSAVAAELGTLSLEFTRLAQITGNHSYYDAVARITNALDEFQFNTTMPGLYPVYIDTSGCRRARASYKLNEQANERVAETAGDIFAKPRTQSGSEHEIPINKTEASITIQPVIGGTATEVHSHRKRQESIGNDNIPPTGHSAEMENQQIHHPAKESPTCIPQGLTAPHLVREEKYGLGAMIDSLYEYFIKEYLLLGGNDQYKRLYASSMDVAGKELTFRPNVPGNPDILLTGNVYVTRGGLHRRFEPESSHLACFTGGMFAMGAKALSRPEDLDIGSKLTDGCVWSYGAMKSGIMPENYKVMACENREKCTFSREEWVKKLSPPEEFVNSRNRMADGRVGHTSPEAADFDAEVEPVKDELPAALAAEDAPTPVHQAQKRVPPPSRLYTEISPGKTAEDFAEDLIAAEDLPQGFLGISDRRYILRPEAIESVWYMYRISADIEWADKGWEMWSNVIRGVTIPSNEGASAVYDVTLDQDDEEWDWMNSMESFWFGETLKYYYLLFSEPDMVSLDDYVLNTEAHPLRRADYGKRRKAAGTQ